MAISVVIVTFILILNDVAFADAFTITSKALSVLNSKHMSNVDNHKHLNLNCYRDEDDISPDFEWSGAHVDVVSFTLIVDSQNADGKDKFTHWCVFLYIYFKTCGVHK